MDRSHYEEMLTNLDVLEQSGRLHGRKIYLFGHSNATETLADLLCDRGYMISGILDNNPSKHGNRYREIVICPPEEILREDPSETIVCIAARAYEAMTRQLRQLGYGGEITKLVDYNSYAEYSLSESVVSRKKERLDRGILRLDQIRAKYPGRFLILCPFAALGDIFFTMSYLPRFLAARQISDCVVCVPGNACRQVAELFGLYPVETYAQKELDELIQACIYMEDGNSYIAHQDRPYVVNLHKALYTKCIPLEQIYCCGVFGLPGDTVPVRPRNLTDFPGLEDIPQGKSVILAPYAKSVTMLPQTFWKDIVQELRAKGYSCFTNVAGGEKPLEGTTAVCPTIAQMQSVVERAGIFIGIRSGICDVIRYADCRKIAFYPDYNYCDTRWKAIDMYAIDGWENIPVGENFQWKIN
ncbi:MAG: hypothetical protein NC398_06290 [Acetatifactor muris]|nr:hypothetical protein [Acetatifactor muris]MCM1526642.1 hypothetical protein [Bacteroides sp.]